MAGLVSAAAPQKPRRTGQPPKKVGCTSIVPTTPARTHHSLDGSMSLEAPAPSRHIASAPTSLSCASRMLETYLKHSERHPHLHPDALITPTAVTFSSHGGPAGGVVMHNLRRVAAGLRGEYLEPEGTPAPEHGETDNPEGFGAGGRPAKSFSGEAEAAETWSVQDDWQDKAEYEHEQGAVEIGEIGDRTHVVREGGEEPEIGATGHVQATGTKRKTGMQAGQDGARLDKDARKRAKKERNKQQRREQERKRAEEAE